MKIYYSILSVVVLLIFTWITRFPERLSLVKNTLQIEILNRNLKNMEMQLYIVYETDFLPQYKHKGYKDTVLIHNNTFEDYYGKQHILIKLDGKYYHVGRLLKLDYWKKYDLRISIDIRRGYIISYQEVSNFLDNIFLSEKEFSRKSFTFFPYL